MSMAVPDGWHWNQRDGRGSLTLETPHPYNAQYLDKYDEYEMTALGKALTRCRAALVDRHADQETETILDYGCCSGTFLNGMLIDRWKACGFDIIPGAMRRLTGKRRWDGEKRDVVTMWDVLEHLEDPTEVLSAAKRWVFVAIPVFESESHALKSKHLRPNEHKHYFTPAGLVRFFDEQSFSLREWNYDETKLGRDGIASAAFERRPRDDEGDR